MIKTLLKKQLLGALSVFTMGKNGKKRSTKTAVAFALLIVYAVGACGYMFWMIADSLCKPLASAGMAWVYFAFMGTIATGVGVLGGIFTAKARLYEARDNELLLSMPIPSWVILFSRTLGLYAFTFFFEGVVFVPAIIRYFTAVGFSFLPFVCSLAVLFVLPFLALSIAYLLGWLIALLSAKIPGKNIIETTVAIAFLIVYFALYSKLNEYLGYVVSHGEAVGRVMKTALYPFAQLGYACEGKGLSLLLYAMIFIGVFALVYLIMSATYLRFATANKGHRKVKYTGNGYKGSSDILSLVKKELLRYSKNGMVMLNCFMGTVLLVLLPFIALFEKETFLQLAGGLQGEFALVLTAILCVAAFSNLLAPSSVSMEGESLDVVRVLPIKTEKILFAKGLAHALTTGIPAAFACGFLCGIFRQSAPISLCVLLAVLACVLFCSVGGVAVNLLLPNLKWTNEVAVVKQSASTIAAMFGGWGIVALLVGGYFLFGKYLPAWGYLLVCSAAFLVASVGVCIFLKKKGVKIFEGL